MDAESFDAAAAANDPELGIAVPKELDIGNIQRRSRYAPVYLVRKDNKINQIILPVYGSGLWGRDVWLSLGGNRRRNGRRTSLLPAR